MNYSVLTAPTAEPVTVAECKTALRVDGSALDTDLAMLIQSAREVAEQEIVGWIAPQEARLLLADWREPIVVARGPVRSVKAISYWNGASWQALAAEAHVQDQDGVATVIYSAAGWPALGARNGSRVRVDLNVGFADADNTPACVKRFVIAQVGAWLSNPEATAEKRLSISPLLAGLLDPLRTYA